MHCKHAIIMRRRQSRAHASHGTPAQGARRQGRAKAVCGGLGTLVQVGRATVAEVAALGRRGAAAFDAFVFAYFIRAS